MIKRCNLLLAALASIAAPFWSAPSVSAAQESDLGQAAVASADSAAQPQPTANGRLDYCGRSLGSWFYCEAPRPAPKAEEKAPDTPAEPGLKAETPPEIKELDAYHRRLQEAADVASWNPTPQNVERYVRLQKVALDKSGLFSDLWRRLVWTTPDLDYTLQRPTMALAKTAYDNERTSDRDIFLRGVSDDVGVFYVYSGTCAPCRMASPIVKSFADRYGVTVKVISTDGAFNPVFGPTMRDHGQLAGWGIDHEVTPALLIYQAPSEVDRNGQARIRHIAGPDGHRMQLRPCMQPQGCLTYLGAGVMSVEDIAERFFVLLSKDPGTDY